MKRASWVAGLCSIGAVLSLDGCAHVKPHEREALSRPSMDPSSEVGETGFQAHLRESREGATASSGRSWRRLRLQLIDRYPGSCPPLAPFAPRRSANPE